MGVLPTATRLGWLNLKIVHGRQKASPRFAQKISRLCMYSMLYASRLSTTPARSLIRHAIFSQAGPSRRVDAWGPVMKVLA